MRYLKSEPFAAQLGDRNAQHKYRDNWERTFGKKTEPEPEQVETKADEAVTDR